MDLDGRSKGSSLVPRDNDKCHGQAILRSRGFPEASDAILSGLYRWLAAFSQSLLGHIGKHFANPCGRSLERLTEQLDFDGSDSFDGFE